MPGAIFDQRFYEALVLAVVALTLMAALLTFATLLHHVRVTLRLRRQRLRRDVLLPLVCAAVSDPTGREALLEELRRSDRRVLLPILLQLALDLRGEEATRVSELAEASGLGRAQRRRLRSVLSTRRSDAVKNLGLLRSVEALPRLLRLLERDPRREVRIAAAWAIGELGGRDAVQGLLGVLEAPDPGLVRRAQEVLIEAAPDTAMEVVAFARRTESASARCAAVELLGALRDPLASGYLLERVADADAELRTKVIKAAAAIADPRFAEVFRGLLRDPAWSVRCQAATGLGNIGATDAIAELAAALGDEAWWVRFNAASSLAELGSPGRAALAEATTDADPVRSEVARYVLGRTGLVREAA